MQHPQRKAAHSQKIQFGDQPSTQTFISGITLKHLNIQTRGIVRASSFIGINYNLRIGVLVMWILLWIALVVVGMLVSRRRNIHGSRISHTISLRVLYPAPARIAVR